MATRHPHPSHPPGTPATPVVRRMPRFHRSTLSLWLMVIGSWAGLLALGWIAVMSLVSLGPEPEPSPSITITVRPSTPRSRLSAEDAPPLWSLGTVAMGCALGSLMVTQRFRQSRSPRRLLKRSPVLPNS